MTADRDWDVAFPPLAAEAARAVEAVMLSWNELAKAHTPGFNPTRKEPDLTRVLHHHVDTVSARSLGLLGMWATEPVVNVVNSATNEIKEERRLDIVYGWNDDGQHLSIRMVFEFKKVSHYATSRKSYLESSGLMRFVDGLYSKNQPIAAMVGILMAAEDQVVKLIRTALTATGAITKFNMQADTAGVALHEPSPLFPAHAKFDTHHVRPPHLAHPRGRIEVAHLFLPFGYPLPAKSKPKAKRKAVVKPKGK